jgi:hypothetical protein
MQEWQHPLGGSPRGYRRRRLDDTRYATLDPGNAFFNSRTRKVGVT